MIGAYVAPVWPHSYFPPRSRQRLADAANLRALSNEYAELALWWGCDGLTVFAERSAEVADHYAALARKTVA